MNGSELTLAGGLLLALILIVLAMKWHLTYRSLCLQARDLEKECRKAVYEATPEVYKRNYRREESEFIKSSVKKFRLQSERKSKWRILLTMTFLRPDDRFEVEPIVRECAVAKVNSTKKPELFVHLHTTLSSE